MIDEADKPDFNDYKSIKLTDKKSLFYSNNATDVDPISYSRLATGTKDDFCSPLPKDAYQIFEV